MSETIYDSAPQPDPTDPEIFQHGVAVFMVASPRSMTIEKWVRSVAAETGLRMDWRMIGGRGTVLVLGDRADCERGQQACADAIDRLKEMYMACPYNFTKSPSPDDVVYRTLDIEAP